MVRNKDSIHEHYFHIMDELGIRFDADNFETPTRVAKALLEMTENLNRPVEELKAICTTFTNKSKGIIVEQDEIEFTSMCSHHHLPFIGRAYIRIIPTCEIIGLSKLARIVEWFSKKPQVQEDLTREIGDFLVELLDPKEVEVVLYDCQHTCMCSRGVKSRAKTKTTFNYFEGDSHE